MRILHIITRLDRGGSAGVVLDLAAGLKNRGHDVFIATGPTVEPQRDIESFSKETGIKVVHIKPLRRNINLFLDIFAFFKTFKVINDIRPDVLHTHTSKAGFIGRIAGWAAGTKVIVHTPHGHVFYGYYSNVISKAFILLERFAARFSDAITTLTLIEKEEYVREGVTIADKITVIPCGIAIESFFTGKGRVREELDIKEDTPLLGWVGRLESIKGCEVFLKVCSLISKELPYAKFLVAGDGPLRKELEELASSLNLNDRVSFLGFREDMPAVMNSIDLLVHTPLNEGLGRVLLEAMACKKPIVTARVGGIPEIVDHGINGLLVPSGDYVSMAEESLKILKDSKLAERLGQAGRQKTSVFGTELMVEKTHKLYRELLAMLIVLLSIVSNVSPSHSLERIPGVIHLDTTIGDGMFSPEEMVRKVKEAGLKVAVVTDKDNQKVEYGIPPLRKIIRKTEERQSVRTYGAKDYLDLVDGIGKQNPDMTIIAGLEAVPFYYWEGSYFNRDLKLMNFHKHLLVIGLEKPEDIKGIPSVCCNNPVLFNWWCLLNAWPLLLLPAGLWLVLNKKTEYVSLQQLVVKKEKRPYFVPGLLILLSGLLFSINNIPFCKPLYDQYHGDRGLLPYQTFIDYVENKGGMVFWAHPDVDSRYKQQRIEVNTPPYSDELLRTSNYTGFAVLLEGMKTTGRPGGIWDAVLKQYLNGQRRRPVWAIGELDFNPSTWMGETQTVFLVDRNNRQEILKAMREGRMYAVSGDPKPVLDAFQVWDDKNNAWVEMGGTAAVGNNVRLRIHVRLPEAKKKNMKLKLIREGAVIKEIDLDMELETELTDDGPEKGRKTYYRIDIDGKLISNPIFVQMGAM